jgi:hypothetical protein
MTSKPLSEAALAQFRVHDEQHGDVIVDAANRPAYVELARAGLMAVGHSFSGGRNSIYGLTKSGFEQRPTRIRMMEFPSTHPNEVQGSDNEREILMRIRRPHGVR